MVSGGHRELFLFTCLLCSALTEVSKYVLEKREGGWGGGWCPPPPLDGNPHHALGEEEGAVEGFREG